KCRSEDFMASDQLLKAAFEAGDVEIAFELQIHHVNIFGALGMALVAPKALLRKRKGERPGAANPLNGRSDCFEGSGDKLINVAAQAGNRGMVKECRHGEFDAEDPPQFY